MVEVFGCLQYKHLFSTCIAGYYSPVIVQVYFVSVTEYVFVNPQQIRQKLFFSYSFD